MSPNDYTTAASLIQGPRPPLGNDHTHTHAPPPPHVFQMPAGYLENSLGVPTYAPPGEVIGSHLALQPPSIAGPTPQPGTGASFGVPHSLQTSPIFNPSMSFQPPVTPNIGTNGGHFQTPGSINSGTSPTFLQSPNGLLSGPPSATQQHFYHQSVPQLPSELPDRTQASFNYKAAPNTFMSPPPAAVITPSTQASGSNLSVDRQVVTSNVHNPPSGSADVFYLPRRLNSDPENRRKSMADALLQMQNVHAIHGSNINQPLTSVQGILDSEFLRQEIMQQPPPRTTAMSSSKFYTSPPSSPSLEHSLSITPEEVLSSFANDSGLDGDASEPNITIDDLLKDDPFAELTGADFPDSKFQTDSDGTEPELDDDAIDHFGMDVMEDRHVLENKRTATQTGLGLSVANQEVIPGTNEIYVQKRSPRKSPGGIPLGQELFKTPPQLQQGAFSKKLSSPPRFLSTSSSNVNLVQAKAPARALKKAQSFTGGFPVTGQSSPHPHLSLKDCSNEFATNLFIYGTNPGYLGKAAKKGRSLSSTTSKRKSLTKLLSSSLIEKPNTSRKPSSNTSPVAVEFSFPDKKALKNMESGLLSFQLDLSSSKQ